MPNPTRTTRLSLEQGRALIDALKRSGITASAYARSNDLDPRRLSFWKRRLRTSDQASDAIPGQSAFIEIDSGVEPDAPATQPKPAKPNPSPALTIDVQLANGIRLTIHPDADLSRMVAVAVALSKMGTAC
jgi:hypothetical protein